MEENKLKEVQSLLKTIILKNQTSNVLDNKLVIGLKLENNTVHFTLELLPEQLKESQEIKKVIEEKLLLISWVKDVKIILTAHNIKKKDNNTYERIATPKIVNSKRIDVVYKFNLNLGKKMYKFREIHKVRHFSLSDIEKYSAKSALKPIHYCEMITKKKPSNMTWKILTVLKK